MENLEDIFLWSTIAVYSISFCYLLSGIVFNKENAFKWGWYSAVAGFVLHTLVAAVRWIESGHPPVFDFFEHSLAGSWSISAIIVVVGLRLPHLRNLCVVAVPVALLILGYGIMAAPKAEPMPMTPTFYSPWLWVHVFFSWVTYGAYHVAAIMAVVYLIKDRALEKIEKNGGELNKFLNFFPDTKMIDVLEFKLVVYGFIAHLAMLGTGALWAYGLWGNYWAWDPLETWCLITWLIYGLVIHLRVTYKWDGRKMAWLVLFALVGTFIVFGGVGFSGGLHVPLL